MISIDTHPICFVPGVRVFISHQRNDRDIALEVQNRLKKMQIKSFLDVTDKGRTGFKSVTDWIIANLRKSTHVIVIYTNNTKISEWVPFEIGVSYEREEGIAILTPQQIDDMPLYLNDFPRFYDYETLKIFASFCKDHPRSLANESARGYSKINLNENYARFFIEELKNKLR